ncbi:MAG TPA: DUF6655 family protein [Stellaceae bacterium]|nr:DUF6655 family protein [Stellaceae bacterium]
MRNGLVTIIGAAALAGCTIIITSNPQRTATEELLISKAAEQATDNLKLDFPAGTQIFVDTTNFDGYDSKYAIGTIRDHLMRQGAHLVDAKGDAKMVLEIRSGALSIDETTHLWGIPGFTVPVPLTGNVNFPEIALYKKTVRAGVAKFAATGYDPRTGALISTTDPQFGFSQKTRKIVLLIFSSSTNDTVPPGAPIDGASDAD